MLDKFDKNILSILQQDGSLSVSDIASQVGLSTTPCWRRIQSMEKSGVIKSRVVLASPEKLNVGLTVFVMVKTNQHNQLWLNSFTETIEEMPEVMEFYRLSGSIDYLLRMVVPDMKAFDVCYKRLITKVDFSDISSSFAMEELKYTTRLPLNYV
ncbi:MAG: Lrp/AsnC family transcriptional regulator [Polaribacter sp.]|jgi:Lrp/AsnC family transcriptional regulator